MAYRRNQNVFEPKGKKKVNYGRKSYHKLDHSLSVNLFLTNWKKNHFKPKAKAQNLRNQIKKHKKTRETRKYA